MSYAGSMARLTNTAYQLLSPIPAILITVIATALIRVLSRQLRVAAAFAVSCRRNVDPIRPDQAGSAPAPDLHLMTHPFFPVQVDPSYPSGHTVFVTAFVVAAIFVLRRTRWPPLGAVLGAILVTVIAVSLSTNAVHYPTDVLAPILWPLAVAPAARLIRADWLMPRIPLLREPARS